MAPLTILELVILGYFVALNLSFALSTFVAARELARGRRSADGARLRDLLHRDYYKPISILVPAYDEEATIVASLRSLLQLQYPEFEVIVVDDGSNDATARRVIEAFDLTEASVHPQRTIETAPVRAVYRSETHRDLILIVKENGGKADALNAALQQARYPVVCAIDADSLLDGEALLRASYRFVEDDALLAVGGTVRVLNGAEVRGGKVVELNLPRRWVERFQVVEYTRAFLTGRVALGTFGLLLIVSGAFGLFRRSALIDVGGYRTDTVGEDMELVVRLHRRAREANRDYRIVYTADPICWTQAPSDWGTLRSQRNRWHRGLWETLWRHRAMLFGPRYGRVGLVAMPYYLLFEALAPVIEFAGYLLLIALVVWRGVDAPFALLFLILAVLCGVLVSVSAFGIEALLRLRYGSLKGRATLLAASVLENFGYRQALAFERVRATFQVATKRGEWGAMEREAIDD